VVSGQPLQREHPRPLRTWAITLESGDGRLPGGLGGHDIAGALEALSRALFPHNATLPPHRRTVNSARHRRLWERPVDEDVVRAVGVVGDKVGRTPAEAVELARHANPGVTLTVYAGLRPDRPGGDHPEAAQLGL
jgi:hypothetical protein